ncbi:helix-turn-helix domain-containing protein [Maledivibacter halophilus]|uniref:Transcriptional regulator, contains XRE-family HTH domain n=1 Tax=Maledivibacter halophilus TaxID=36842 RepID=A0A1T5LWA7_9FIRM|nr:helix-turn-helix transcriptional regulator [Maledivibacter halophilus]SKC79859.1 Transcriptional regulator, contains XRE-family HTH domain [Maledivibacter halophilus]
MSFGDKIRSLREENKFTQSDLASKLGISTRTLYNYEKGKLFPKDIKVVKGLAEIFNVSTDYLMDEIDVKIMSEQESEFLSSAKKNFGYKGKKEAEQIIEKTAAMFAGGTLSEEDQDKFFESITKVYFDAKKKARETYGRKSNREK